MSYVFEKQKPVSLDIEIIEPGTDQDPMQMAREIELQSAQKSGFSWLEQEIQKEIDVVRDETFRLCKVVIEGEKKLVSL